MTAASATQISIEEHLRTPFRPDVDYVERLIEERSVGEYNHGMLQATLDPDAAFTWMMRRR